MAITPFRRAGRDVYYVSFRHPGTGKQINRSLGTDDPDTARGLAIDVERICRNRDAWDITHPVLLTFPPAAVHAFHGCKPRVKRQTLSLPAPIVNAIMDAGRPVEVELDNAPAEAGLRTEAQLRQDIIDRDITIAQLEEELQKWRKRFNAHVNSTLGAAVDEWARRYPRGRAEDTVIDVLGRVREFEAFCGSGIKLSEVKGSHVDAWLQKFEKPRPTGKRDKAGAEIVDPALEPRTIRRRKAAVSVFFSWCVKRFEMFGSPIEHTHALAGVQRTAESIVCIRRLDELTTLLESLEGYWRAVAAVGCLAGLRLAELCWMKRDDVYLAEGYMRVSSRAGAGGKIVGTKTGKERSVPIERTKLLPILKEHLSAPRGEYETGPWVFASNVDAGTIKRTKTPAGLWSHGKTFIRNLNKALTEARGRAPQDMQAREFWTYGAWEWRHTAGTAMGLSGMDSLRISKVLGNSQAVCERHYIGIRAQDAGVRWPFKW